MIRASNIVMIYFIVGAVMFGGGAVTWDNSGPTQYFLTMSGGHVHPSDQTGNALGNVGPSLVNLIATFGGGALLVWNLIVGLISFLNWPIFVFLDANAPPPVTIIIGGSLTVAFYMALIRVVRSAA